MLNKQIAAGRFTADPDLRATGKGTSVCRFTIASDDDIKGPDGQRDTDFIDCVAWAQQAEFISKYFQKGQMAIVIGRPKTATFTDREGTKRRKPELHIENIYFAGNKNNKSNTFPAVANSADIPPLGLNDDDCPF